MTTKKSVRQRKRKIWGSATKYKATLAEGHRPARSADMTDPVRNTRSTMPVNMILRSMANKIVPAPFKRQAPRLTMEDVERLRPAFSKAYREHRVKAFLLELVAKHGRNVGWWRQAFYGYVRFDS